jgi:hypothetical protein
MLCQLDYCAFTRFAARTATSAELVSPFVCICGGACGAWGAYKSSARVRRSSPRGPLESASLVLHPRRGFLFLQNQGFASFDGARTGAAQRAHHLASRFLKDRENIGRPPRRNHIDGVEEERRKTGHGESRVRGIVALPRTSKSDAVTNLVGP